MDGDTIEVLHNKKAIRVRLQGIDCPEKAQAFGQRAKQATSALVFAQTVTIASHGQDKYERTVGTVVLSDGTNINRELVAEGSCWEYGGEKQLGDLRREAAYSECILRCLARQENGMRWVERSYQSLSRNYMKRV